tara:strand:- start:727 stop:1647 length:921 start_codon:yes stop_codon:yes gene_type:complete
LENLLILLLSTFFSWFLIKKFLPKFEKYLIDEPNKRSSHIKPTPSGGGLVFVILGTISSIILGNWLITLCLPIAIVGFIDDKYRLPSLFRYFVQVLTVSALIFQTNFNSFANSDFAVLYFIFYLFLGTAIINFINFMDGVDGLVSGCVLIIFLSFFFNDNFYLAGLLGALIGFLIWNWQPAKIFMGDIGSTFLGTVYLIPLFSSNSKLDLLTSLLIALPLLGDAFFCVIRRFINKEPIFKAHKKHLYQRLNQAGISHSNVSMLYIGSSSLLLLSNIFIGQIGLLITSFIIFMFGVFLDNKVALNFK